MTNRKALLQTLSALFIASWLAFAGWFGFSWNNSKPYSVESVLGASTDPATVTLAPYPKTLDSTGLLRFGARHYALYNPESGKILLAESAVDRGHRDLPIKADFVGKNLPTTAQERVDVRLIEEHGEDAVCLERP